MAAKRKPTTKKGKRAKASRVMREFHRGELTTHGKRVTSPAQAKAIAMSEAGLARPKRKPKRKR